MSRPIAWLGICVIVLATYLLARGEQTNRSEHDTKTGYQAPQQLRVALVDVALIVKRHERLKAKMERMKEKVDAAEAQLKENRDRLRNLFEQQKLAPAGSPLKDSTTKEVTEMNENLNKAVSAQKEQFMQEEGRIYYDVSVEIDRQVERCAKKHGIGLVLRFNGDPVNPTDRNEILRGINKAIMYFEPQLNITEEVLAAINADH